MSQSHLPFIQGRLNVFCRGIFKPGISYRKSEACGWIQYKCRYKPNGKAPYAYTRKKIYRIQHIYDMPKSTNKGELSFPRDQNLRSFPLLSDPFLSFPPRIPISYQGSSSFLSAKHWSSIQSLPRVGRERTVRDRSN